MSVINTNITSMIGQSNLTKSQNALQTSMERLSSGLRINSAKDDAAGQAIANRMTAQITGLAQAQRNANDGISIAQTAEGSLNQINDNLQRIRELTVQAANGTNSQNDLQSIQDEVNQRLAEIDRISRETDFNGTRVLSEDAEPLTIQVGAQDGQTIEVGLRTIDAAALGLTDFDVRAAIAPELSEDAVENITTGEGPAGATAATTFGTADVDVVIAAGDVQFGSLSGIDFGGLGAGDVATASVQGFQVNSAGALFAEVTLASTGGTTNETAYVAISASNVSAGGTVDLTDGTFVTATAAQNSTTALAAASTSQDLTFTFADQPRTLDGGSITVASGASFTRFVQSEGETLYAEVDAGNGVTEFYAITESMVANSVNGVVTLDTTDAAVEPAFTQENLSVDATAITGEGGTLRQVLDAEGEPTDTYVADFGNNDLRLANISAGGTATVQQATATLEDGSTQDVDVRFGGIDGETLYAQVEIDGEMRNFAVTGNADDGFVVDLDNEIAIDSTSSPLAALDAALNQIDSLRSELGAVQNRFEDAITNLSTNETNLSAARSRIEDADYAVEVANMTRAQILQQAGTSVLAQANQIPQNVLSLLG